VGATAPSARSEIVTWMVCRRTVAVTEEQVFRFESYLGRGGKALGINSRPVMPVTSAHDVVLWDAQQ